jgi:hypothetical protein
MYATAGKTKKAVALRIRIGHDLFQVKLPVDATMRSRSKTGEAGLCCAQSCGRPEPIEIMVLPTVFNRKV